MNFFLLDEENPIAMPSINVGKDTDQIDVISNNAARNILWFIPR